jgi:hypothetical protein
LERISALIRSLPLLCVLTVSVAVSAAADAGPRDPFPDLKLISTENVGADAAGETPAEKGEALKSLPTSGRYTVIPLPAFSYTRNESYWIGALMPILKSNAKDEVEDIVAPQYLHNRFVGETLTLNYYGYRGDTIQYRAIGSYATKVERNVDLGYKDTAIGGGRYILALEGTWFKNAFARFFGLGNQAPEANETNYTARETRLGLSAGVHLGNDTALVFTERYRDVRVDTGVIPTLPQTKDRFPNVTGVEGAHILGHRLSLLYDTRDDLLTPVKGRYVAVFAELNQNLLHREPNRWSRYVLDARQLIPHGGERLVFVARFLMDATGGPAIPFYERPTLGGETTLRAFGTNRFISDNALLVNLEERIQVLRKRVFDHAIELELAPFLDFGRVSRDFRLRRMQFNPGIGLRLLARPHIVGRIDVAYGRDGDNVFVGLDYPF